MNNEEHITQEQFVGLRTIWSLFMKWHIAFNTFNLAGLAFVSSVPETNASQRTWLCWMFFAQSALAVIAAILIGRYSNKATNAAAPPSDAQAIPKQHNAKSVLVGASILMGLVYALFACAWIAVMP